MVNPSVDSIFTHINWILFQCLVAFFVNKLIFKERAHFGQVSVGLVVRSLLGYCWPNIFDFASSNANVVLCLGLASLSLFVYLYALADPPLSPEEREEEALPGPVNDQEQVVRPRTRPPHAAGRFMRLRFW